ncbi:hypothetical protein Taro_005659 [Colocasia esculenta]|uniref:UDP-glycosyltransferase 83A1 n=1 Tax=Colocasia esculenta TaxID=4460 RepID=A0A843TQF7_COLES|nr:hypothetical protein [Colocasia esculenta]
MAMGLPHAVVVPYPAQGHVISLMELSHCLVDSGFRVTFVNTEHIHSRIVAALSEKQTLFSDDMMRLVAVPDGLPPGDDSHSDLGRLTEAILRVMPGHLEELIRKTNESAGDGPKITCVIADQTMAWAMEVARKMGLRAATYWPAPAAALVPMLDIPKLIEDGAIDSEGCPKKERFQLAPCMPAMSTAHLVWNLCGDGPDGETRRMLYRYVLNNNRATKSAELIICNTFSEVELPVLTYAPFIHPVGPLRTGRRAGQPVGHLWSEDKECLAWLDGQPAASVVYVAFGSFTVVGQRQFQELALGLELSGRPFLWVVRPDLLTDGSVTPYPAGFCERVAGRGKMVGWAPQHRVLAHPAVACFFSHCGWNSTMEGVTNGLPFLCWPYFADQHINRDYICDAWRTGLGVSPDAEGVISKEEIKGKLEALLGDEGIKERATQLKEAARKNVEAGGTSCENFRKFVEAMKG